MNASIALRRLSASLVASGALCAAAFSAGAAQPSDAQSRYAKDRAACMAGKTYEDRTTCLKEAGAAQDEARRGELAGSAAYQKNATQRCNDLPDKDRADCVARIQGDSTKTSGSVGAGGVIRERTTTFPAPK